MAKYTAHALDNMFSYIIIRNSTFLFIVLNSYPILELIGTDMKHKIINLKIRNTNNGSVCYGHDALCETAYGICGW